MRTSQNPQNTFKKKRKFMKPVQRRKTWGWRSMPQNPTFMLRDITLRGKVWTCSLFLLQQKQLFWWVRSSVMKPKVSLKVCFYLPRAFSWWTVSQLMTWTILHFRGDQLLQTWEFCYILASVLRHWGHWITILDMWLCRADAAVKLSYIIPCFVCPLVPENRQQSFGDDGTTFEGLCRLASCWMLSSG